MALDYDLFREVVAPEYASMTDDQLDLFAGEAEIEITEGVFKKRYPRAVALLTAHLIAMSKKATGMGGNSATAQLKRVKVGDLEREYARKEGVGNGSYDLTIYGSEFLRLRKQVLRTPLFVGC